MAGDPTPPAKRKNWNWSVDFGGDTFAVGFVLNESTRIRINETLHKAIYGPTDKRTSLGGLLLYEPTRGVSFIHGTAFTKTPFTDHYVHAETPFGTYTIEQYYDWGENYHFGDNEMLVTLPAGDWTLIFTSPGGFRTIYDLSLEFPQPVNVTGPIFGPLGFNLDERAFNGTLAVVSPVTGILYDRHCTVTSDHHLIHTLDIAYAGQYYLSIEGPEGRRDYVALFSANIMEIGTTEWLPRFRMYEPGDWTFSVNVGTGQGYSLNLFGIDLPLPSENPPGYYEDDERHDGCA